MARLEAGSGRSHGALLSRLLWPTGILFAATFAMVVATFIGTARDADRVGIAEERSRIEAALEENLHRLETALTGFMEHARRVAGEPDDLAPAAPPGFDGIAVVNAARVPVAGAGPWHLPQPSGLSEVQPLLGSLLLPAPTESSAPELRGTAADGEVRAGLASDGRNLFALAATPAANDAIGNGANVVGSDSIVAWKRIDSGTLARLGAAHGIAGLRLVGGASEGAGIPLLGSGGAPTARLAWDERQLGAVVQQRIAPLVVAGMAAAVLLFGAVVVYYFWTTRHLAEAEAISKAMLGRDPLSGLPNRMLFNDRLDHELLLLPDKGRSLAVMFIDLDRFKDVNDSYGHQAGDELIKLVAQRLLAELPDCDTLARFGGDEFAIIQTDVSDVSQVSDLSKRILEALGRPFSLAHSQVNIGTSIGVAMAPAQASDRHSLLKLADTALYQAKNQGRNRTSFFQTHMDETIRMRKVVEDDLRQAIAEDGLVLHYQPVVSASGETIVGVEALVRWPHPERGLISPAEFVPIAEERGLVIPLGEWVLRRACEDGKRWPGLRIAINVSPIQFRHRKYVETVMRVLAETGFEAARLELELTEGVVVADADAAEAAMVELRALGVNLALDDFGTGYSSLIYLRRFAFDKIKIDRSFLESMEATGESAILVHSIVHLGRALGLIVTAEGVETREQHRFLQALGCHQLQGYLFSRPVPAESIDGLLAAQAVRAATAA